MTFKDYFSAQSDDYAKYRPHYPAEIFAYLASIAPGRDQAWDCATGNGQAARGLAAFFDHVVATDGSATQLQNAPRHDRVEYRVAPAESAPLESSSVDVITVAQALHWFDLDRFYPEAKRVLKPRGVLAVWVYDLLEISPAIDPLLRTFYGDIVGPYWPLERTIVEERYRGIPFPFEELDPPPFQMSANWSLPDLLGYLRTWSATQRFIEAQGADPVADFAPQLLARWGEPDERKPVRWPLYARIGRRPADSRARGL